MRTLVAVPDRVVDAFFDKVQVRGHLDCWPWLRSAGTHGYGQIGWSERGRTIVTTAHRVAWTTAFGSVEEGLTVRQTCRNRLCQNPGHLELLSTAEANWQAAANNRDKTHCSKGHSYAGKNLVVLPGERRCRVCAVDSRQERARRVKALNHFYRRLERELEVDVKSIDDLMSAA